MNIVARLRCKRRLRQLKKVENLSAMEILAAKLRYEDRYSDDCIAKTIGITQHQVESLFESIGRKIEIWRDPKGRQVVRSAAKGMQ